MKKNFKTNILPPTLLSIACVGVLAASFFIGRERKSDFRPETPAPDVATQEWQESAAPGTPTTQPESHTADTRDTTSGASTYAPVHPQPAADSTENYPKVTEETDQLVTIDFTPEAEKLHPDPPEPPTAEGSTDDPKQPPVYTPEELEPEPTVAPAQPDTPTAGATNNDGAIYDPVFGWVVPGNVSQTPMDSDGDPNKMVGNM